MIVRKTFLYKGCEIRIADIEETYMNAETLVMTRRVLAPNGGIIPILIVSVDTLKSIESKTRELLDTYERLGKDTIREITKPL